MAPINLTEGAIAMLSSADAQSTDMKPVLQVADIRLITSTYQSSIQNQNIERYRILLSDGLFTQQGMLATQRNGLVRSQKLQKGSIIQLSQFVCNLVQERMIIIIIDLDVIVGKCDPVGEPKKFPVKTDGNVSSVPMSSTPAQPHRDRLSGEFSNKRKEASSRFVEEVIKKNAIKQQKLQFKMEWKKMKLQSQKEIEQMRIEAKREQEQRQFEKDMMMEDPNSALSDEGKIWIIEQQRKILNRAQKNKSHD